MSTTSGSRDYGRFDELAEEFVGRYRRGERPSLQEYVDRLPEMAEEIREMFPALVEVERADGDARGDVLRTPPIAPHLSQIGDYRILREVGRGGMGVVYEAEQVSLGRRVALKVLPGHVTGDRQALERFRREAKSAARLHHTNIVPVFEVGRDRDVSFYAMQLIQGQGLDQVFEELRRLRQPGQKADGQERAPSDDMKVVVTDNRPRVAATSIVPEQALAQLTANLLAGRLAVEGSEVSASGAIAATGLARTERFDPAATSSLATDAPKRDHSPTPGSPGPLSSAVMPGGKHVSEVDTSGRRQPFFRSVAQIGRQTAQGLAYAHARGVIHRDIKPSNLLLDTEGVVWITDFGLAKADDDGLTASGDILGTLRYMAPERFRGEGDARADIYALGLTLYELLTLRSAYNSSDRLRLIERIKNEEPVRPRLIDPQIPRDLETIVLKAIDKHPDHRYPTADALAEDLRRFLADEPIKARQISTSERYWRWSRRNPAIAALGGVLTAVLVMATIGSLLMAARFANLADAERGARIEADEASKTAETARAAALAETYRATLSGVKALRAGRQLGWRDEALKDLGRLAVMPTPRRDLAELRTEAVATIGEFGVKEVARFDVSGWNFSIGFSPDSRTLAGVSAPEDVDGDLNFWDVPGRKLFKHSAGVTIPTKGGAMRATLARFLDGGDLAYIDPGGVVAFADRSARRTTRSLIVRGQARAISLATDRPGRWLAVGWDDHHIGLFEADTGSPRKDFDWDGGSNFMLSPDGKWLALQGPGPIHLVPTGPGGQAFDLPEARSDHNALAFSPDGTRLAAAEGRAVLVWDLASRRKILTLSAHKERIHSVAFSPDGSLIASCSTDATTRIWDAHDGRPLTSIPGPIDMELVAFSPDGTHLAAAARTGPVCLYQLEGRLEQRRLIGHSLGVFRLASHPSLPRLASAADDAAVMVWDMDSARPLVRSVKNVMRVSALAFSPDGSLIASAPEQHRGRDPDYFSIRLMDATTGTLKGWLTGNTTAVYALAFDPTGRRVAAGDWDGNVLLFEVGTGKILRRENLGTSVVTCMAFLEGGRSLLVGQLHGALTRIDLDGSAPPRRATMPGGCYRLAVNRRGDRAIVGGQSGALIGFSLPDLRVVHQLDGAHAGEIHGLALSPDEHILASGGYDRHVVLRDPETFQPLLRFPPLTGRLEALTFDSTSRWLAYAGTDSEIVLWDLDRVREELAAGGLAWDRTASRVVSPAKQATIPDRPTSEAPLFRESGMDQAELQEINGLIKSGIEAYRRGRFEDALPDFQGASLRLRPIRHTNPGDPGLIRLQASSLTFLAISLRNSKRPGEALARSREALAVYESLARPSSVDLWNMAHACVTASTSDGQASSEAREKLDARAVDYLQRAISLDTAQILPLVATGRIFDSLRHRADFRGMMADAGFPSDPFAQPLPMAIARATPAERKIRGEALIAEGRTLEAIPYLASAWEADQMDSSLLLKVAALQAWFRQDAELAATCQKARQLASGPKDRLVAERTAKVCSLRPSGDPADRAATLALAHAAYELSRNFGDVGWFRMALGIAEYRAGHDEAAAEALRASLGDGNYLISVTSAFYLAMSLSRQGKDAEARQVATEAISRMRPLPPDENNPLTDAYHDDLILWMAYKEAKALLKLDANPDTKAGPGGR